MTALMLSSPRRTRRVLGALLALVMVSMPTRASSDENALPIPFRFGVVAEELNEPGRMLEVYGALIGVLREKLRPAAIEVGDIVIARDLEDLSQRLIGGEVDFVIETVFPTLVLQKRSGVLEPALVVFRRGEREYRSIFFTPVDSDLQDLTDLKGRVLVLQALRSTSAFAIPKAELERIGLSLVPNDATRARPEDVRYVLADAEINQAVWVLHGKGAAGAFNEGDWERLPARVRAGLRIFHETAPLLRGLLSFRATLAPDVRAKVESALLGLEGDEAGRAAGVTRLERLTPQDRRALETWAAILRPGRSP